MNKSSLEIVFWPEVQRELIGGTSEVLYKNIVTQNNIYGSEAGE